MDLMRAEQVGKENNTMGSERSGKEKENDLSRFQHFENYIRKLVETILEDEPFADGGEKERNNSSGKEEVLEEVLKQNIKILPSYFQKELYSQNFCGMTAQVDFCQEQWNLHQVLIHQSKTTNIKFLQASSSKYLELFNNYSLKSSYPSPASSRSPSPSSSDSSSSPSTPSSISPIFSASQPSTLEQMAMVGRWEAVGDPIQYFLEPGPPQGAVAPELVTPNLSDHELYQLDIQTNHLIDILVNEDCKQTPTDLHEFLSHEQIQSLKEYYHQIIHSSRSSSSSGSSISPPQPSYTSRLFTILSLYSYISLHWNQTNFTRRSFCHLFISKCLLMHELTPFIIFQTLQQYSPHHHLPLSPLLISPPVPLSDPSPVDNDPSSLYVKLIHCISRQWKSFERYCNTVTAASLEMEQERDTSQTTNHISKKALLSHCQEDVCGICLLRDPSCPDITVLCCGSIYHIGCLLKWFHTQSKHQPHGSCPTCRNRVKLNTFSEDHSTSTLSAALQAIFQFPSNSSYNVFGSESSDASHSHYSDDDDSSPPGIFGSDGSSDSDSDSDSSDSESSDSSDSTDSTVWSVSHRPSPIPENPFPPPPPGEDLTITDDLHRETFGLYRDIFRMGLNVSPINHTSSAAVAPPLPLPPPAAIDATARSNATPQFVEARDPFISHDIMTCSRCHNLLVYRGTSNANPCSYHCCADCCRRQPLFCLFHYQGDRASGESQQLDEGSQDDSWSDEVSRESSNEEDDESEEGRQDRSQAEDLEEAEEEVEDSASEDDSVASQSDSVAMDFSTG
jgi:hypothetical protein